MRFEEFLKERKSAIVKKWFDAVISTYPDDARGFFKREKDRFSNPVGQTISTQIETLYDLLLEVTTWQYSFFGVISTDTQIGWVTFTGDLNPAFDPTIDNFSHGEVVPLPSAVWLFGSGLISLAGFNRKLRKK